MCLTSQSEPLNASSENQAWHRLYGRPLVDLGQSGNPDFSGIYSPGYGPETVGQYVQTQFLDGAERYTARYTDTDRWRMLIERAFDEAGVDPGGATVLDLGSGAGNTIVPLLDLCSGGQVIASDLSATMLAILKKAVAGHNAAKRLALLELNAEELDFLPQSFDLVIGGAVLRHLLDPSRTIEGCARILKPGGHAIFFEPFENGNAILARIYHAIISRRITILSKIYRAISNRPDHDLPKDVRKFLTNWVKNFALRQGRDKSAPIFRKMDDKWCFTKRYFEALSETFGFSLCTIYPLHDTARQFEDQTEINLRLGPGRTRDTFPDWAWEIIRQFDSAFSEDLKADMLIEGCIILRR